MGLLGKFFGKVPQDYEIKGDAYMEKRLWGEAKLAYETALEKFEKEGIPRSGYQEQLESKLTRSKEGLAAQHAEDAKDLIEAQCYDDARELLGIALQLTQEPSMRKTMEEQLGMIERQVAQAAAEVEVTDDFYGLDEDAQEEPVFHEDDESYFVALCGTLPEAVQEAYLDYGETFREGYLALNRGDFETAVKALTEAMAENPLPESYIPYELASAQFNLGQNDDARDLLEDFIAHHADALPAYRLLCEIYWDEGNFTQVKDLLDGLPQEISESVAAFLLWGENLYRSGQYTQARDFYDQVLEKYEWNSLLAQGLALACEALGESERAIQIYGDLMNACTGCGTRIDPFIKRRYADLKLAAGDASTRILEIYLDLVRDDPENAVAYYRNVSRIYALQGNEKEARRFQAIAEKVATGH